jgi:hypothetical protein
MTRTLPVGVVRDPTHPDSTCPDFARDRSPSPTGVPRLEFPDRVVTFGWFETLEDAVPLSCGRTRGGVDTRMNVMHPSKVRFLPLGISKIADFRFNRSQGKALRMLPAPLRRHAARTGGG